MTSDNPDHRLPLFPLHTVLFPGCSLPLQIFEQRYLRLVKECLRDNTGFVTALISEGREVGAQPVIYTIGTEVSISDWQLLDNGLFGITITAGQRVHIDTPSAQHDGLLTARVLPIASPYNSEISPVGYDDLAEMLTQLGEHPFARQTQTLLRYDNHGELNNKLAYLLPVSNQDKQQLLEINDTRLFSQQLRQLILQLQKSDIG